MQTGKHLLREYREDGAPEARLNMVAPYHQTTNWTSDEPSPSHRVLYAASSDPANRISRNRYLRQTGISADLKQSRTRITQMQPWRSSLRSEVRSFGRIFCFFGFAVGSVGSGCFPPSAAVKAVGEADTRRRNVTATDVSVIVSRHQVLLESRTFGHQGETMITGAGLNTADWGVLFLSVVISWYKIYKSNRYKLKLRFKYWYTWEEVY